MPELNLDLDYFEHPKVMLLADALGEWAEILPIKLWRFTAKFHPSTGVITGPSVNLIERHLNWRGKKGDGIKALVTFGFLKEIPGGYEVHDFLEHQGHIESYKIRGKAGAKAKWAKRARDATSIAPSNGASIDASNAQTDGRTDGRSPPESASPQIQRQMRGSSRAVGDAGVDAVTAAAMAAAKELRRDG